MNAMLLLTLATSLARYQDVPPDQDKRIEKLVQDLGADDIATRDKAGREILDIGRASLDQLEKAAKSDDPEIRARAQRLLNLIPVNEKLPPSVRRVLPEAAADVLDNGWAHFLDKLLADDAALADRADRDDLAALLRTILKETSDPKEKIKVTKVVSACGMRRFAPDMIVSVRPTTSVAA